MVRGLFLCMFVGGGVGVGFCLGFMFRFGISRLFLFFLRERSRFEWGYLTRGGWNVAIWFVDLGFIRVE